MSVDCVVFDIDDTLYLEREYVRSGFRAVGSFIQREYGLTAFFEEAWRCFEGGRRNDIFNVTLNALGERGSNELVQRMVFIYRNHDPEITLLTDADECLRSIGGKRFAGVISDGVVRAQTLKISRLGLAARFDHIIFTEAFGVEFRKPNHNAFLLMQEVANCSANRCMYVADNPMKDFLAPKQLGWRTVRVRRDGGIYASLTASEESQPEIELRDLKDLLCLLGNRTTNRETKR